MIGMQGMHCRKTPIRKKEDSSARGKQCTKCGTRNHLKYPQTTRPGAVNTLDLAQDEYLEDPDEYEYARALDNSANDSINGCYPKKLFAHLVIDNSIINFQLNCGGTLNIMPSDLYLDVVRDKDLSFLTGRNYKRLENRLC